MAELAFGILRYFVIGFSLLGLIILCLHIADKIRKRKPKLSRALSTLIFAGFYAVLLAAIASAFVGPRVALYLLGPFYVLSLFGAWKSLGPD